MTLTVSDMSNNITKQCYRIIKTFKFLIIVKKEQFARANVLIQNRPVTLNKQAFFDLKNIFMIPISQDGKLVEG